MAVGDHIAANEPDELLSFAPLDEGNGLEIVDHIERRHFSIFTPEPVEPTVTSTDAFQFPVSRAVTVEASGLRMPQRFGSIIRNSLGFMVAEISTGESRSFPPDRYSIDPGASIKTYIAFEAGFSIASSSEGIELELDSPAEVHIGARSHHKQPAERITTTDDFQDLATAMSYLSSSLKTLSCERSYPTLRGHPPTVELGDSLEIPPVLSRPDSGIRVELPPDYRYLFGASSLAYYLGAEIREGDAPRLVTEEGFEYRFDGNRGAFEDEVERVLKQVFFLDCVTRTEGLFQVNLNERTALEDRLDFPFAQLYGEPLAVQLEAYLNVPYSTVASLVPKWKLTAHVDPAVQHVEYLPFVVNELGVVTTSSRRASDPSGGPVAATNRFMRGAAPTAEAFTRSTTSVTGSAEKVHLDDADSIESTWVGDGMPLGPSKAMMHAFRKRLGRTLADDDIDITVVCNANEMGGEMDLINDVYGSRDELPFDVSVHRNLRTDELRDVLEQETEFLHYIGHIEPDGFECPDGRFDAVNLESTGIEVFFLNACTSYEQGRHLIEAGSIAGVVTLHDVINSGAERVGATLARVLNCGFPLQSALNIARKESIMGGHYLVIGDGGIEVTQPEGSAPAMGTLEPKGERWTLQYYTFPTSEKGLGTITSPTVEKCDEYFLNSGENGEFDLTLEELQDFMAVREIPLLVDDELTWTSEFSP